MIAINLKGGLGNILFQIAAGISISKKINCDVTFPNLINHLDYLTNELTYNPKLSHGAEYLKLNFLKNLNTFPIKTDKNYYYPFCFADFLPDKNSFIDGFFQSEMYFTDCRELIISYFESDLEIKNYIKFKYSSILENATSLHVRRGDYLNFSNMHKIQNYKYFQKAISILRDTTSKFLIHSDDIEWCKSVFIGDEFVFIENEKDYIELHIMSMCKNNIISNSSFSWWGAWLNNNSDKIVVAPSNWFGPDKDLPETDIIPHNWMKI